MHITMDGRATKTMTMTTIALLSLLLALSPCEGGGQGQLRAAKECLNKTDNLMQRLDGVRGAETCKTDIQLARARLTNVVKDLAELDAVDQRSSTANADVSLSTVDVNRNDRVRTASPFATLSLVSARFDILNCRSALSSSASSRSSLTTNSVEDRPSKTDLTSLLNDLDHHLQAAIFTPLSPPKASTRAQTKPRLDSLPSAKTLSADQAVVFDEEEDEEDEDDDAGGGGRKDSILAPFNFGNDDEGKPKFSSSAHALSPVLSPSEVEDEVLQVFDFIAEGSAPSPSPDFDFIVESTPSYSPISSPSSSPSEERENLSDLNPTSVEREPDTSLFPGDAQSDTAVPFVFPFAYTRT